MPRCDSIFMGTVASHAQRREDQSFLERGNICTDLSVRAAYFCTIRSAGMFEGS